jgi:hypothetical protein
VEKELIEALQSSAVLKQIRGKSDLPPEGNILKLNTVTLEKMLDAFQASSPDTRWGSMEQALLFLNDARLIVRYAVILSQRWLEAEGIIRESDYLWNYSHHVMRDAPIEYLRNPKKITPKVIQSTNNAETKRILIDLYGVEKYLHDVKAECLDVDSHPMNGNRCLLKADGVESCWLICACPSSGRVYFLAVPPNIKTCKEADAWLSGGIKAVQVGRT